MLFAPGGVRAAKHQPIEHTSNYTGFGKLRPTKSKENIFPKKSANAKRTGYSLLDPEVVVSLKEEIKALWTLYNIEKVYQEAFIDAVSLLNSKLAIQILAKEIENLRNEKANVQQIDVAILDREETIRSIHQLLNFMQNNPSHTNAKNEVTAFTQQ